MGVSNLDRKLQRAVDRYETYTLRKAKELKGKRYHYARELGFTAKEAVILQNWHEEDIKTLAIQRRHIPSDKEYEEMEKLDGESPPPHPTP